MALTLLTKVGYGQVEPNHLSAQRTAQIYAQLPADAAITELQNGQFVKYDMAAGKVALTGKGEYMLVFNEVKNYEDRQTTKNFALKKSAALNGVITPRVFKTNIGDILTTNLVKTITLNTATVGVNYVVDQTDGILSEVGAGGMTEATQVALGSPVFTCVKVYTLADGQKALKLQRTA